MSMKESFPRFPKHTSKKERHKPKLRLICPDCDSRDIYTSSKIGKRRCRRCGKQFSIKKK